MTAGSPPSTRSPTPPPCTPRSAADINTIRHQTINIALAIGAAFPFALASPARAQTLEVVATLAERPGNPAVGAPARGAVV